MGSTRKKRQQRQKEQKKEKKRKDQRVNENILSSISDPNPWTPDKEDAWLKQPADVLEKRFPPMTKPRHIKFRGSSQGWGD